MPSTPKRMPGPRPVHLALLSVAAVFALHWVGVPLLDLIELRTYDLRFRSRGAVAPPPEVVLVTVDEKSLDTLGRWPWPRSRMAELVDALSADGARVIGFDIGFLEPESPESDGALARAIRASPADVVLGYFFHMEGEPDGYRVDPAVIERDLALLAPNALTVRYRGTDPDAAPFLPAHASEGNLPMLAEAADGAGFFTLLPDDDGVVRRSPLVIQAGGEAFPSLALASAWQALGRPPLVVDVVNDRVEAIRLGERTIPTDGRGRLLVDFPGPARTFPHVSAADVLAGTTPPGHFHDRVVLVGVTAKAVFDLRATPFGPVQPGLEVQASALGNLLEGRFVTRPGWADLADQAAIVGLGLAVGLILPHVGALGGLLVAAAVAAAWIVGVRQAFVGSGLWLNMVYPLLSLGGVYTALTVSAYVGEQRERRRVASAFGQYVSPVVIEQMLADPSRLRLGGEERVLTVLFSDLVGFTTTAEAHTPSQTIELLSEYYARMTEQIYACDGMLKEYVGDELMAIFGAPVEQPDHARRACRAALRLRDARAELSREWGERGRGHLRARTGVNSGVMLVGNIGSEYRFSYGVVGDAVNLGSRLESLNKTYGTEILVGEATADLVRDEFRLREVDHVRAMGKSVAIRVYELLGEMGEPLPSEQEKAHLHYAAALAAYRERRFADGLADLEAALSHWPDDGPSRTLQRRLEGCLATPPPPEWDGIYDATEK